MTDQVRRMAGEAEPLENTFELGEAPAAFIGAVHHHDVLGHIRRRSLPVVSESPAHQHG